MKCEETAEFVSALYDGERIPREAAEHLGACEICKTRLIDYVQMSVELKRVAIAMSPQDMKEISWGQQERLKPGWWQKGWVSMRIPRFAFGAMLASIVALVAGIALAKAHASNLWFQFEVRERRGSTAEIGLMAADPKGHIVEPGPVVIVRDPDGTLAFIVRVLAAEAGAEKLGVRAVWFPAKGDQSGLEAKVHASPETEFWVIPGQKLSVPVKDYGRIEITGQLLDKLPDDQNPKGQKLYPKDGAFRLTSPQVLLVDGRVVSKGGGDGSGYTKDSYFAYYVPHDGYYIFAFNEFPGATEGNIDHNQVEFTVDGKTYSLIAAAPIVEPSITKIWIRHHANSRLVVEDQPVFPDQASHSSMAFGNLKAMLEHMTKE